MSRARIGVISAGSWSESSHLPALAGRSDVELVIVTRPDEVQAQRVSETFGAQRWSTNWRDALDLDLDGIVVSSPPVAHEEQVTAAFAAGSHVLVEKPFALDRGAARRMRQAGDDAGRALIVGFGWPSSPVFALAHQWIAEGRIGEIESVTTQLSVNTRSILSGATDGGWAGAGASLPSTYVDVQVSGGGVGAVSMSHQFGLMLWLSGMDPVSISAMGFPGGERLDLHHNAVLRFGTGAVASAVCASTHPYHSRPQWYMGMYGAGGDVWIDSFRDYIRLSDSSGAIQEPVIADGGVYDPGAPTKELVDVALGLREPSDSRDGTLAVRVAEITDALYESSASGRIIEIDRSGR